MIVISPAAAGTCFQLPSDRAAAVLPIGTERYSTACFEVFRQPLEVSTLVWTLRRSRSAS